MNLPCRALAQSLRICVRPSATRLAVAAPSYTRGGSSASNALPDRLDAALEGEGPLPPELLKSALDTIKRSPKGTDLATKLLTRVADSLESSGPALLRRGECVEIALELPNIG